MRTFTLQTNNNLTCAGRAGVIRLQEAINNVDTFSYNFQCVDQVTLILLLCFSIFFFLIMITGTTFVCIRYRWRIRYCRFMLNYRVNRFCSCGPTSTAESPEDFKYDAYLSFSSRDRQWVYHVLTKELENTYGFRIFYRHRDQVARGTTQECILRDMKASQRVILVVGKSFNDKEYCLFELNNAQRQTIRSGRVTKRKHVIVIKLEEPASMSEELSSVLDTHSSIEWSENKAGMELFWSQLRTAMYQDSSVRCNCFTFRRHRATGFMDSTGSDNDVSSLSANCCCLKKQSESSDEEESRPLVA